MEEEKEEFTFPEGFTREYIQKHSAVQWTPNNEYQAIICHHEVISFFHDKMKKAEKNPKLALSYAQALFDAYWQALFTPSKTDPTLNMHLVNQLKEMINLNFGNASPIRQIPSTFS